MDNKNKEELNYSEEQIQELTNILGLNPKYFGPMLPYILKDEVTDIEWDGRKMKIEDLKKGPLYVDSTLSPEFCEIFAKRIADKSNKQCNDSQPELEAESKTLRITITNPSVALTGYNINIRKIEAKLRMTNESIIEDEYCTEAVRDLIKALVISHCSGIFTGGTGTGKTEAIKFFSQWIPNIETIVTLEDTNELKLYDIYPDKFVRPIIINRHFNWTNGIEYALRCNARYLLMAEARGEEALKVIECVSTGLVVYTCIHAKDVTQIPDRVDNMIGAGNNGVESKENDIYTFFDFGIKIAKESFEGQAPHRYIDQLCIYERKGKENIIHMIVDKGKLTGNRLPNYLLEQFEKYHLEDPLIKYLDGEKNV